MSEQSSESTASGEPEPTRRRPPGPENTDGFFDRFVHPWLARAATLGFGLWLVAFVLAAGGLAGNRIPGDQYEVLLFLYSGVIGTLGIVVLGICTLVLAGFFLRREWGARR
jgi:hypothetical protein